MKYYKVEKPNYDQFHDDSPFYLCSCVNKPSTETHIISHNCQVNCTNFISRGEDKNGLWIECKYYNYKIRKDKLTQLKNEVL